MRAEEDVVETRYEATVSEDISNLEEVTCIVRYVD
jgi:hypothetical protein